MPFEHLSIHGQVPFDLLEQSFEQCVFVAHSHSLSHELGLLHDTLRAFEKELHIVELCVNLAFCLFNVVNLLVEGRVFGLYRLIECLFDLEMVGLELLANVLEKV